jgi:RNA polymerase subunit RPABC4/transcription elongation factor Spt4
MSSNISSCKVCGEPIAKSAKSCPKCGASNKKPFYKRWWFWILIVIIATGIIVPQGSNIQRGDPGAQTNQGTTSTGNLVFGLNETAIFPNLNITALEVKTSTGNMFSAPESGNIFVGVRFEVENTSDRDQMISSFLLFDAYADGVKADLAIMAIGEFNGGTIDGTLSPGRKLTGWFPIEISTSTKTIEYEVKSNWLRNDKAIFTIDLNNNTSTRSESVNTAFAGNTNAEPISEDRSLLKDNPIIKDPNGNIGSYLLLLKLFGRAWPEPGSDEIILQSEDFFIMESNKNVKDAFEEIFVYEGLYDRIPFEFQHSFGLFRANHNLTNFPDAHKSLSEKFNFTYNQSTRQHELVIKN